MRGAAMSLTAALSGFVVLLLSGSAVQGQRWAVTYNRTQICAVKGSTVEISCTFTYPSRIKDQDTEVKQTLWFSNNTLMDVKSDSDYRDRVHYNCDQSFCSLTIRDLRESDSAEFKFAFTTNHPDGRFTGSPGVTLSVTALQVQVIRSTHIRGYYYEADLECQSSCQPDHHSYVWIKNGKKTLEQTSASISASVSPADRYSCAVKGYEEVPSPPVYDPKLPSVSVSPSGEIVEGSSVTLTCSSDANPAATYTWYKDGVKLLQKDSQLVFRSISSSDSGQYYCKAENKLGWNRSESKHIDVKYAPKLPSVSVSPSGEIVEGSSVTLTCSSDANPAATYTWYKEDQTLPHGAGGRYHFTSISSEDKGIYYCRSENQHGQIQSSSLVLNITYAPKLPSVSVNPSGEIVEGSSVTLTCCSDANPAATYTWYKEDEESPKASGPIFTITDVTAEHSGNYSCEGQNTRGSQNSTVHLTVVRGSSVQIMNIIRSTLVVLMLIPLLVLSLWMRMKKSFSSQTGPHEAVEMIQLDSGSDYQNISG